MSFWKSVRIISKHRWVVLGSAVIFILPVWLTQRNQKPIYEATATILPSEAALQQPVIVGGTGGARSGASRQTQLANLMRLAESRTVAERTAKALGSNGSFAPLESLQSEVVSEGEEGASELLEMHARSADPMRAVALVNMAADVFVNYHQELRLRDIQSRRQFLEDQMQVATNALRRAESDLQQFEQQHGIALLSPGRRRYNDDPDMASIQSELSAVRSQIRSLTAQLMVTPQAVPQKGAAADPTLIRELQQERDSIHSQLESELATNPASEKINQFRRQMADLDRRLASSASGPRTRPNPEYENLMREMTGLKEERTELLRQLGAAQQAILATRGMVPGLDVKLASLMRAREGALDRYSSFQAQVSQARLEEDQAGASPSLQIIDEAGAARGPLNPPLYILILAGALAGLVVGVILAHVLEAADRRIRTDTDVESLLELPVTALIPRYQGHHPEQLPRVCYDDPISPIAEAFRFLRTDVLLSANENGLKTILVATAKPGQGGSMVAANLAICLAQDGKRVVLVDADLRRPSLHRVFKLENQVGLAEVLKDEHDLPDALANTEVDNLALISGGNPPLNPAELLGSWRMRSAIGSLKEVADFVVIDTPAAVAFADTVVLSPMVDGVLMVMRAEQVARGAELQVRNLMNKAKARILGVVLNDVPADSVDSYHYYSAYYPGKSGKKNLPAPEHDAPAIPPPLQS